MIDIPNEIQKILEIEPQIKSRWVKNISTRMRVFNTQIFDNVYEGFNKENAEMVFTYMYKNVSHLNSIAYFEDNIDNDEYISWIKQFEFNVIELEYKLFKLNETNE